MNTDKKRASVAVLFFFISSLLFSESFDTVILHFNHRNIGPEDVSAITEKTVPYITDFGWSGLPRPVVLIDFRQERLELYGLTFQDILDQWPSDALAGSPYAVDTEQEILFFYRDRLEISPDIWEQIFFSDQSGNPLPLSAVAEVQITGYIENILNPEEEVISLYLKFNKNRAYRMKLLSADICSDYQGVPEFLSDPDSFRDRRIELKGKYFINGKIYTLAFESSAAEENNISVNLYDYDITPEMTESSMLYKEPVFSERIDQKLNGDGYPVRFPSAAVYSHSERMITVFFDNGTAQTFSF